MKQDQRARAIVLSVLLVLAASALRAQVAQRDTDKVYFAYVGTYTGPKSQGIYRCRFNATRGTLVVEGLAAPAKHPSFLAVHPSQKYLYAVGETSDFGGKPAGSVLAFAVDATTGELKALNQQSSRGGGPCHLVVDQAGKNVLVANYGGGSAAVLPIQDDGSLGPATDFEQHEGSSINERRQEGPHAHSINLDPQGQFAFVADLGLDEVRIYRFDPLKGTLTANEPPAGLVRRGSGPRHFAFHPSGKHAYVLNELLCTVTAFDYDASRGALTEVQTLWTIPGGPEDGHSTAEIVAHPEGKFVYASNRGHDTIAAFAVESSTGKLRLLENVPTQGKTPRNFAIDPTGKYLLAENQSSDTIVLFRIDGTTGRLVPAGVKVEVPSPVCVRFVAVEPETKETEP